MGRHHGAINWGGGAIRPSGGQSWHGMNGQGGKIPMPEGRGMQIQPGGPMIPAPSTQP